MKHSTIFPALILIICLCLAGCTSAEPPTPTAAQISIPPTQTPPPAATITPTPEPTPTALPAPPTPTVNPSLYPDIWVAGLLWGQDSSEMLVGNSSGPLSNTSITYEPADEAAAAMLNALIPRTLVVLHGDYIAGGEEHEGHMIVERGEQVYLPYSQETSFSAVYTHPDNLFSFSYPENWSLTAVEGDTHLELVNRTPDSHIYQPPGSEMPDDTFLRVEISVVSQPLDEYIQSYLDQEQDGEDVPEELIVRITVSEQEINGLPVTHIQQEYGFLLGRLIHDYVVPLNDNTLLVFSLHATALAERLLSTLELFGN